MGENAAWTYLGGEVIGLVMHIMTSIYIYIHTDGAKPDRAIGRNDCGKKRCELGTQPLNPDFHLYSSHTIWLTGLILNSPMCYFALMLYIYIYVESISRQI